MSSGHFLNFSQGTRKTCFLCHHNSFFTKKVDFSSDNSLVEQTNAPQYVCELCWHGSVNRLFVDKECWLNIVVDPHEETIYRLKEDRRE